MKWVVDANVLFAAVYANHTQHAAARAWLDNAKRDGWGVATETFLGVVRLLMNPKCMDGQPCRVVDALRLVRGELSGRHPGRIITGVSPSDDFLKRAQGHGQVMDFYLVNVAFENSARLATMDSGIIAEWPQMAVAVA